MPRRRNPETQKQQTRTVTVHLDEETAVQLDQFMFTLGIESKGATLMALARAQMAAHPMASLEVALVAETLREVRVQEFNELAMHFDARVALLFPTGRR